MSASAKTQIRLQPERLAQIRMIADARGTSIAEVLTALVRSEIEKGTIPRDIPGVTVSASGNEVRIDAQAFSLALTQQAAGLFADRLREVSRHPATGPVRIGDRAEARIRRRGAAGVEIHNLDTGEVLAASNSLMADLADIVADHANP